MQVALPWDVTLGAMAEIDRRNDPDGAAQHTEWVRSASLSHDLARGLSGFVEMVGVSAPGTALPSLTAFDTGVDWEPRKHVSLGLGVSFGRSDGHGDTGMFGGVSLSR